MDGTWEERHEKMKQQRTQLAWKLLKLVVLPMICFLIFINIISHCIGNNAAGTRTVVQYVNGSMFVKFDPGWYMKWFGKTTVYKDVLTFDFDRDQNSSQATIDQKGISVRYGQDGGTGHVYGIARFILPADEPSMILIHREFMSFEGIAYKLVKSVTEESMNLTASLMSSEDAYATKRATFTDMTRRQIANGPFITDQKSVEHKDEITGKTTTGVISVIKNDPSTNLPMHSNSDLKKYNITLTSIQLGDPDFEGKTLEQIAAKREATNAIITAKANAERAKQDAITAEEQGLANVKKAQYEKEVLKRQATVDAEKEKEVATIKAQQAVEVARQSKLEATERKLGAVEYKQEQVLKGEGDGAYKRLVMEADGALAQKLDAIVKINTAYAHEFGKQKWVPEIQFNGTGATGQQSAASDFMSILTAKTARDIGVDMGVGTHSGSKK